MSSISSSKVISPTAYARKDYGHYTLSATQTADLATNSPIKINTVVGSSNIAFNPATYTWTLKANKTYRLSAQAYCRFSNDAGYLNFAFRTTADVLISSTGQAQPYTYAGRYGTPPISSGIYTPTVDTNVTLDITINSSNYADQIYADLTWAEIEELETFSPMVQTYQYAYVSPELDLTVTSAKAGFVLTRAKGIFYKTNNGKWYLEGNIAWTITSGTSADITIGGIDPYATQHFPCTTLSGVSMYRCTMGSSGATSITSSGNATNFYATFRIELLSKPTGYAIPADV